jgi:hypothetical protein
MLRFESVAPSVPPLDRALTAIAGVQKMTPHARIYMRQVLRAYGAVRAGHKLRKVQSFWEGLFIKDLLRIGNERFVLPESVYFRENNYMEVLRLIRSRPFLAYVVSVESLPELQSRFYMIDGHVTANFLSLMIGSDNGRALIQSIIGHRIFTCMDSAAAVSPKPAWPVQMPWQGHEAGIKADPLK